MAGGGGVTQTSIPLIQPDRQVVNHETNESLYTIPDASLASSSVKIPRLSTVVIIGSLASDTVVKNEMSKLFDNIFAEPSPPERYVTASGVTTEVALVADYMEETSKTVRVNLRYIQHIVSNRGNVWIETSSDNVNWTIRYTSPNLDADMIIDQTLAPLIFRYLRVRCRNTFLGGSTNTAFFSFFEIKDNAATPLKSTNLIDNNTVTKHKTYSEINCFQEAQFAADKIMTAVAVYKDADTDVSSLRVRCSKDRITWVNRRLINYGVKAAGAWYKFRFNAFLGKYLQIRSDDATAKTLASAELRVYTRTTEQMLAEHGHIFIDPDDNTLADNGL